MKSFAALPLINGNEVIGVIGLASAVERDYERQAGFLETLAGHISVAIANARLFELVQQELAERKRAEEALRRSEEHFRALIEYSSDMIFIVDQKGINTYVSSSVERVLGYTPEDLTGRSCYHIILPVDVPRAIRDFGEAILTKDVVIPNVFRVRHKDGSERTLEGVGRSLFDHPAVAGFVMNVRDITERKRAEEALRESEEKHRILLEQSPDPIFSFTPEGRYKYVNRAFAEGVGKSVEDIIGRTIWDVFPKEEADKRFAFLSQVFSAGQEKVIEVRVPRADGDRYYVTTITPIKDAKGKVLSAICSSKEITERKRMEESLRQAAEKRRELEFIVNQSPVVVFLWKATEGWPVEYVSENIHRFGYTPADLYSARVPFASIVHPDDLQRVVAEVTAYSREPGREQFEQQYRIVAACGKVHWLDDRTWIRRNEKGEITHYQGIVVDITERKLVEKALRESEERYRKIFENSIEGIFQSTPDGHYLTVNPSFAHMFGFDSPEQMIGAVTNISSLYAHPEDREEIVRLLGTVGEVKNYEAEINRRDGKRIWISIHAKMARDEKGNPLFFDGTVEDITERKKAEQAIQEQMDELRRWHEVTLGRETRILDLKREVNELLAKTGQPPRYESAVTDGDRSDRDGECGVRTKP